METSTLSCFPGMGLMDHHGFINNWSNLNDFDELTTPMGGYGYGYSEKYLSHQEYHMEFSPNEDEIHRPMKQQKSSSWGPSSSSDNQNLPRAAVTSSPPPSFHVVNSDHHFHHLPHHVVKHKEDITKSSFTVEFGAWKYDDYAFMDSQAGAKRVTTYPRLSQAQAQDHIIAERKRREKLSQGFTTMSALLPGLKKLDRASILGDAIKYIQQLKEKVTTLEVLASKKSVEKVVFVRKNSVSENGHDFSDEQLPVIETKVCQRQVLIRIHCEKIKGIQEAAVAEIENLPLSVTNSSALSFGDSTLDITIIAKMEEQFSITIKDLVMHLRSVLNKFM